MHKEQIKTLIQFSGPYKLAELKEMCRFSELKQSDVIGLLRDYNTLCKTDKGLWTIFGKGNGIDDWTCLQVGSSRNIKSELQEIFRLMMSKPQKTTKATTFHENVYNLCTYMDKTSVKYRSMYNLCEEFVVYEIDVLKYLKDTDLKVINFKGYNNINYAEVKFANETKALYWNPAPKMKDNQEWEIYNNEFKK